jgi:hypothetical protein
MIFKQGKNKIKKERNKIHRQIKINRENKNIPIKIC